MVYGLNKYILWFWGSRLALRGCLLAISVQKINNVDSPMVNIRLFPEGQPSPRCCSQLFGVSDGAATCSADAFRDAITALRARNKRDIDWSECVPWVNEAVLFLHHACNTNAQRFKQVLDEKIYLGICPLECSGHQTTLPRTYFLGLNVGFEHPILIIFAWSPYPFLTSHIHVWRWYWS